MGGEGEDIRMKEGSVREIFEGEDKLDMSFEGHEFLKRSKKQDMSFTGEKKGDNEERVD